ncbi:Uncharacterised protein [Mycobacteroides abscessus subsp. abscessus]|uniref:hypothetical protein n=1 Tax=Mycobacteroides abscessus TaxID=36809 RepID=UPI0009294006|nr:hypothetical protein [Mycobacteroides abscessus]SIJ21609.1 Uncharacterised protein [Mycobacteroides abscessus subsp. abscessus]SLH38906.1 Uncharacterised protein [Mycobacteroides abscessus subsp. abscessus]
MSSVSFVAKWYTRASRIRIVIAKFDGRWKLPGGPYPIPELAALVAGITATLFLLPRLGSPLPTLGVGIVCTVALVAVMRKMPYSPVPFGTRIHRIVRLYTAPMTVSFSDDIVADLVSIVRPDIQILDAIAAPTVIGRTDTDSAQQWTGMFDRQPSAAAELFS